MLTEAIKKCYSIFSLPYYFDLVYLCVSMQKVAFLFALLIFSQSLSVCGPAIAHSVVGGHEECHSEADSNSKTSSCCSDSKHAPGETDDNSKNDCCGDSCHCFCCVKVVMFSVMASESVSIPWVSAASRPFSTVQCHSFDFHPSIPYPPNSPLV